MHNIEFHTQAGKVSDAMIHSIRDQLLKIFHLYAPISRAEVNLKEEETFIPEVNKVCEIRLYAFGEDVTAHARMATFEAAASKVIKELKRMVKQKAMGKKQVPDTTTSSVKV